MKCPLLIVGDYLAKGKHLDQLGDCLEASCVWWKGKYNDCSVLVAIGLLSRIADEMAVIAHRSPPAPSTR